MKEIDYKIYTAICAFFIVLMVVNNLIYQKFVYLPLYFHQFELSVGAIFYPLTFLLTDLIAEFYGKEKASFCVRLSISINCLMLLLIILMDNLTATSWSKIDDETFHRIFGMFINSFGASMIACYISQMLDMRIYLFIKKITGSRFLFIRSNLSMAISLLLDTAIVVGILTYFDVLPYEKMITLIMNSYLFKLTFSIFSTPIFYLGVALIKYFKTEEEALNN